MKSTSNGNTTLFLEIIPVCTESRPGSFGPWSRARTVTGSWLRWFKGSSRTFKPASVGTLSLLTLLVAFGLGVTTASAQTIYVCSNTPAAGERVYCEELHASTDNDLDDVVLAGSFAEARDGRTSPVHPRRSAVGTGACRRAVQQCGCIPHLPF